MHYRQKNPGHRTAPSGSQCENCHNVTEYRVFCARIAFCCPGVFSYLWAGTSGQHGPNPVPGAVPRRPVQIFPQKSERRKGRWKSPSITTDKLWPWRSRWKSMNFLTGPDHKDENLSHEQRRHWDGREFDEYIVATEGVGIYGENAGGLPVPYGNTGRADGRPGHLHRGTAPPVSCSMPLTV